MSYSVALIADNHFIKKKNCYYVNGTYTKQYLKRFTSNFNSLTVIARVKEASNEDVIKMRESGGECVSFCELPDFNGVKEYCKLRTRLKRKILDSIVGVDALFIRMPCILTTLAIECAKEKNIPIMIDVGADPDSIYRSAKTSLFELLISKYMMNVCKHNCMMANGVSYVTKKVLQKKYPCKAIIIGESIDNFTASISNADISKDFYTERRFYSTFENQIKILHISNNICENSGKGHTESILVLKELIKHGIDVTITFVGGGDGINDLQAYAEANGVGNRIYFTGRIASRNEYKNIILNHDIFLFPSHSEGLPRVLLETMATGMVCVSSDVDGIPEILDSKDIFEYSNCKGMSDRIIELLNSPEQMTAISSRNLEVSKQYSNESLKVVYDDYYDKVRKLIDSRRKNGGL